MNGGILTETRPIHPRYLRMPHVEHGMAVGLFGGSFNPPHAGHALVSEVALRALNLDQLWWIVTPGNPLKMGRQQASLAQRIEMCEEITRDPRIKVTAFEAGSSIRYTADTIRAVKFRNPDVRFVWIMGADNMRTFHLWQNWRVIAQSVPIAIIDRPGATLASLSSKMAQTFNRFRIKEREAGKLARLPPPAWAFIHGPRSSLSSTAIRSGKIS